MKLRVFGVIGIFSLSLFFGCSRQSKNSDERAVFKYNESNGISSLDPAYSRNLENMWAVNQLFDGLLSLSSELEIEPSIAQSWSVSDDGKTYQFNLRTDVRFHDSPAFQGGIGRAVRADDVAFSFRRILDPAVASPGKWVFDALESNQEQGIRVINDSTIELRLSQPFPPFLGLLTTQYARIVPHEAISFFGEDFRSNPVGSGPFQFAFWLEDVALVFHKNQNYWMHDKAGNQLPHLDAVKVSFVRDKSAEYLGLLQGEYHFISGLHPAFKDELLTPSGGLRPEYNDRIRLAQTPFIKTDYIGILVDDDLEFSKNHPLNDVRVRRALSLATDRKKMTRFLRNNSVYPALGGFIPKGLPAHNELKEEQVFDLPEARRLLAEAGYPNGEGIPEIPLVTTADYADLCEFLQFEWSKIGVRIKVDVMAGSVHRERVARSQALMFRKSWLADYADEENFLLLFHSKNFTPRGPNYTHYKRPYFDQLYDSAMVTVNDDHRLNLYRKLDSMVVDDAPVISLYYDRVTHFIRHEVENFTPNPVNMLDLREVRLTESD